MKYYIVDAFTNDYFGGNPAGVVYVDEYPEDALMQKIAAEMRYSETVFVKANEDGSFTYKYFTPEGEVDLCGHATIAAFHTLRENGKALPGKQYTYIAKADTLHADITENAVFMDMAAPQSFGEITDAEKLKELYKVMGLEYGEEREWKPEMVSTGLTDIMMPVKDFDELTAIKPDMDALSKLSEAYGVVGVHAFCLCEDAVHCRNFAPLYGIPEEAATGTSNGALSFYLYKRGYFKADNENLFVQGEAMKRPSRIRSRIFEENGGLRIQVGGEAITLAKGEML